jgi:DNA-binding transcriptional LysR family regulator
MVVDVAQPALSHQIKQIEDGLSTQLPTTIPTVINATAT